MYSFFLKIYVFNHFIITSMLLSCLMYLSSVMNAIKSNLGNLLFFGIFGLYQDDSSLMIIVGDEAWFLQIPKTTIVDKNVETRVTTWWSSN